MSFYKKYYKTIFDIALIIVTIYLFMYLFSYLYHIATPIFLALLIYAMIEPLAKFLHKRGVRKSIATAISTILFIVIILGSMVGLGIVFTVQIQSLVLKIPEYAEILQREVAAQIDYWEVRINALPTGVLEKASEYLGLLADSGSTVAVAFLSWLLSKLTSISTFIINFAIGIILAYFLSIEIDSWKKFAKEKTPRTFKTAFYFLKENVLKGIGGYLKAQFKLISVTFAVIFVCLLLLGVKNAFSVSLLAALFDLLPLLGVSTLFIPWIIYLFATGSTSLAIWLTALLLAVILVRQVLEPKITGDTLGVSAFTMLAFMIISLSLFGISGLILSPILIITIKALIEQGYLQQWIRLPEEEYDH